MELTLRAEISNKRKGAALQMHQKKDANAVQVHTQSQSHIKSSSLLGKEGAAREAMPRYTGLRTGFQYDSKNGGPQRTG